MSFFSGVTSYQFYIYIKGYILYILYYYYYYYYYYIYTSIYNILIHIPGSLSSLFYIIIIIIIMSIFSFGKSFFKKGFSMSYIYINSTKVGVLAKHKLSGKYFKSITFADIDIEFMKTYSHLEYMSIKEYCEIYEIYK